MDRGTELASSGIVTGPLVGAPFLLKPFTPQGLGLKVRGVLDAPASRQ